MTGAYYDDIDAAFRASVGHLLEIGGAVLLICVLGSWLVTRDITLSLGAVETAMTRVVAGDLIMEVPGLERRDEAGGAPQEPDGNRRVEGDEEAMPPPGGSWSQRG